MPQNHSETPRIRVAPTEARGKAGYPVERTVRITDSSGDADAPGIAEIPKTLSDSLYTQYAVQDKIGDGGMGVVYLARDRRLGRYVAIKRLNPGSQSSPSLRRRFLQEARAVAALNHIHIVHIYALGEDSDGPYIVMEYVPGPEGANGAGSQEPGRPAPPFSLDNRLSEHGQLSVSDAIDLLIKIARAIAYAHGCGIIHRDLKPSNVLLDPSGEPKIVDFGLARLLHDEVSKLTVPGEKLLSLGYGAPEQESDASMSDERADVYGLGALLYFAITGQNPRYFREQDIPEPLRDVLGKALATDRDKRWPSADAFCEALNALQSRTHIEQPTVKTTWRCKWCDTVNPLTLRFCAECGWDGTETCQECGMGSHVGVQYCGECGADARAYEAVSLVLRRMQQCMEQRQFERVLSFAGRTLGFEPAGPKGRALLRRMQSMREDAERHLTKREQLKESIPIDIRAENYERARTSIVEYRKLSEEGTGFQEELDSLPRSIVRRDMERARLAARSGDWEQAARIAAGLLDTVSPNNAECLALLRRVARHRRNAQIRGALLLTSLLIVLYILSMAPAARWSAGRVPERLLRHLFTPSAWLHGAPLIREPLERYARLWNVEDPAGRFSPPSNDSRAPGPNSLDIPELSTLRQAYADQLVGIESDRRTLTESRPREYRLALETLRERRRAAGDFEGWAQVSEELETFEREGRIGDAKPGEMTELSALKQRHKALRQSHQIDAYRRMVTTTRRYVNELTDLQREYTRAGNMEAASTINTEMRRARSQPQILEAEAELAASGILDDEPAQILTITALEQSAELGRMRTDFGEQMARIEQSYAQELEKWPEQYVEDLTVAMENFRVQGDFDGWERARRELERFEIDRELRDSWLVSEPQPLTELQLRHLSRLEKLADNRAREIVGLVEELLAELNIRLTHLTKAGNMDAATLVNAEIRRLRNHVEYVSAITRLEPSMDFPEPGFDGSNSGE